MTGHFKCVYAIAIKEWRLNSRFLVEYLAAHLVSPIKTAILMYLIYSGFLKGGNSSLGNLNIDNFQLFVLLGTTCHSVVMGSVNILRTKLMTEKYWQTVTATLVSPATMADVMLGYILGSGAINIAIGSIVFILVSIFFPVSLSSLLISLVVLLLIAIFGFGLGLIGATIALCWEGKSFLFDFFIQALVFLSCFYYPIQTLPESIHGFISILPTYQGAQLIQSLFIDNAAVNILRTITYLTSCCAVVLILPTFFYERSLRKYGIVGY